MMKHEFIERVEKLNSNYRKLLENEYQIIETVYTFYPYINNKDDVAEMYNRYGMIMFLDLLPRAEALRDIQSKIRENTQKINELKYNEKCLYDGSILAIN